MDMRSSWGDGGTQRESSLWILSHTHVSRPTLVCDAAANEWPNDGWTVQSKLYTNPGLESESFRL